MSCNQNYIAALLFCLITALAAGSARAAPVAWHFYLAGFSAGGAAQGGFTYDADTATLGAIHVTSTPDGDFVGAAYTMPDPGLAPDPHEIALVAGPLANYTGAALLDLVFFAKLTSQGGTILMSIGEYACADAACSSPGALHRLGDGIITITEPASVFLFCLGLAGLGLVQNRIRVPARKDVPGV